LDGESIQYPSACNLSLQLNTNFVYCSNCGYKLDSDDEYCPNCSAMVEKGETPYVDPETEEYEDAEDFEESPPVTVSRTPNSGIAMVVSVILPGIGAVIAGNIKGLAVFALSIVAAMIAYTNVVLMPFFVSVMIVLWIVGLSMTYDATTVSTEASPC